MYYRLVRIAATFERSGAMHRAMELADAPLLVRFVAKLLFWPIRFIGSRGDADQPPIVRALVAMGPAYIKFGQLLSTRPDIVGIELASELRILQDKLSPIPTVEARKAIEASLGLKINDVFSSFSDSIAAASIAQVHKAVVTESGKTVAVKILRPGIERAFRRDIDAFFLVARLLSFFSPTMRRLRVVDVVQHFEGVVLREIDLRMEASAADEFAASTSRDAGFVVPKVYWSLSSKRVLTLEWIDGVSIGNVEELADAGHDLHGLAVRVIQYFLQHALRDGYFHADLHPGNLHITADGDIAAMDFGIMGRIDAYTRRVYAEILMGFIKRDYRRVAEVHFEAGYVPVSHGVEEFAQALRSIGEPVFGVEADNVSMARLLAHLFEVTERFGMQTRTELILLQRTMVVAEGVARTLDSRLILWEVAKPVVEKYIWENMGPRATYRDLVATLRIMTRLGPRLPKLLDAAITSSLESEAPAPQRRMLESPAVAFILGAAVMAVLGIFLW